PDLVRFRETAWRDHVVGEQRTDASQTSTGAVFTVRARRTLRPDEAGARAPAASGFGPVDRPGRRVDVEVAVLSVRVACRSGAVVDRAAVSAVHTVRAVGAGRSVGAVGPFPAGFTLQALVALLALRPHQVDVRVCRLALVADAQLGSIPSELQSAAISAVRAVRSVGTGRSVCAVRSVGSVGPSGTRRAVLAVGSGHAWVALLALLA